MIIFRVDSSEKIGSGHLMRCIALAEKLKKYDEIIFLSRDLPNNINNIVIKYGFKLFKLPLVGEYKTWLGVSQHQDACETINTLKIFSNVRCVIVDNYFIDELWEEKIRKITSKLMVIDDLANRRHYCDILLDSSADSLLKYNNLVNSNCDLFLGREFQIFRDEFYKAKKMLKPFNGSVKKILISFGGSDPTNETTKVIDAICNNSFDNLTFYVVVGACNKFSEQIRSKLRDKLNIKFLYQVTNMAEILNEVDLCIGAAGVSTWERVYLGKPSFCVSVADNQNMDIKNYSLNYPFIYLGSFDEVNVDTYRKAIKWSLSHPKELINIHEKALTFFKNNNANIEKLVQKIVGE